MMVFSSAIFLMLYLPIVYILNYFLKTKYSNCFLLIASLIFYAWGEPFFVFIMVISIVINWIVGNAIDNSFGNIRKLILAGGVACNLLLLGYFKYAGFLVSIVNNIARKEIVLVPHIVLPIGISFFTFQAISYLVDVYRGTTEASTNIINVALYISFFPQLIAGPIVKYRDINKQIINREVSLNNLAIGFRRFIYGLGKKVLIANTLGLCVDTIYGYDFSVIDTKMAWIGAFAYTFQIYYDFSGYSDMAIGLGKMFGFDFLENFNYPYMSRSISEFWRRWHISLGSWFKEYVYIPLGGNKKGTIRTYLNLTIVFFLTGLWHGANFSFVFWGLYHGLFSIIERIGFKKYLDKTKIVSTIYCFLIVNFGWVFFRSDGIINGLRYIIRMVYPWKYMGIKSVPMWMYADKITISAFILAVLGAGIVRLAAPKKVTEYWKGSVIESIYILVVLLLCLTFIASDTYNPFIYYQF